MYLCQTELFELELIICVKMDLALNKQQRLICHKPKQTYISDVLRWTPSHRCASIGRPIRTYLWQLCTGCSLGDLPESMHNRDECQERVREIHASSMTWWYVCVSLCVCVCVYIYIYIYIYNQPIGMMVRVFVNRLGDRTSIRGWVIPKTKKWYLMLPCLTVSIIRYRSRVSGVIQRKE